MLSILLFWLIGAIVVAIIAGSRARNAFGWFMLAVAFSPLLMLILVLALPSLKQGSTALDAPRPETHVRCPECRELVRADASKCKHCGLRLVPVNPYVEDLIADRATYERSNKRWAAFITLAIALIFGAMILGGVSRVMGH